MLESNVPVELMQEILQLVPDTLEEIESWRIVPNTLDGYTYSVSSARDILIKHTFIDSKGRKWSPTLVKITDDCGVYSTTIRRASNQYSIYLHHIRYDAFPELNTVNHLESSDGNGVDVHYEGLEWYGRHLTSVHILPVSESDMRQVRQFYPEDLPREIWTYVPGTNHKYVISSQSRGVILRRYSVTGSILRAQIWQLKSGHDKYYQCCLTVGDTQQATCSHIVILKSFIPKPGDAYEVNHIDGDGTNNILDNLEWVTRQQNSDHYNKSPEMAYKRAIGYKKISEFGKLHQKEIQNRAEVNLKRSATLKSKCTEERKAQMAVIGKQLWESASDAEKLRRTAGFRAYNESRAKQSRAEQSKGGVDCENKNNNIHTS